jgi:flagellar FliJ protein
MQCHRRATRKTIELRIRSTKIGKIVTLAKSEEQRLGSEIGRSRNRHNEQLARLGELNAYRHSYMERSRAPGDTSSAHWKDYQNFIGRLDHAVRTQQQIVRDSELSLEKHRQRWCVKRQRLESLQRVLESYRGEEASSEERLRQRALDDMPPSPDPYSAK